MTHRHTSFLLRCWDLGGDSERIEIEHVQSGTKTLAKSGGAAIEWICAHGNAASADESEPDEISAEISTRNHGGGND